MRSASSNHRCCQDHTLGSVLWLCFGPNTLPVKKAGMADKEKGEAGSLSFNDTFKLLIHYPPAQYSRKLTSTLICTATGLPSFMAGSKRQVLTASMAFSSSPRPKLRATLMSRGLPSGPTTSQSTQVP